MFDNKKNNKNLEGLIPKKYKVLSFLEELSTKNKLYSRQRLCKLFNLSRQWFDAIMTYGENLNLDKINVNGKTYFGNKNVIKKIKEMLIE